MVCGLHRWDVHIDRYVQYVQAAWRLTITQQHKFNLSLSLYLCLYLFLSFTRTKALSLSISHPLLLTLSLSLTHTLPYSPFSCISKNIFIGVSTADARLDNYVGCDSHGWAFLANKAVWHGKSKLKTYGELFCTGDTVTVSLDLDKGKGKSKRKSESDDSALIF